MDAGLIKKVESRNTKAYHYEIISKEEYSQLQNSIATALDEALQRLNSPTAAHKQNEPRKKKQIRQLEEQPTEL
jgi:hypothetical protein